MDIKDVSEQAFQRGRESALRELKAVEAELLTLRNQLRWIPASEPPTEYRDEYGELIPFLVCLEGTEYPFRAMYDGKVWGDGWGAIPVTHWMPLPEPPKEVQADA